MPKTNTNALDWNQIKNWLPIVSAALIIAGAFFSVRIELAVLTSKVDQLAVAQEGFNQRASAADIKLNSHETRITVLEINKQSSIPKPSQISQINPVSNPQPSSATLVPQSQPVSQSQSAQPVNQNVVIEAPKEEQKSTPQPAPAPSPESQSAPIVEIDVPLVDRLLGGS